MDDNASDIIPAPGTPAASGCGCLGVPGGLVLVLIGIPMLVCPGPGLVTMMAGLGMIGAALGLRRKPGSPGTGE